MPLSYQWRFNGNNLPGATSSRLTLPNLQLADAGEYSVLVSNSLGSVLSSNAVLTVTNGPPIILVQPADQAAYLGGSASFNVVVDGSPPFSYQWRFKGADVGGAAGGALLLSNLRPDQTGGYEVLVTNGFGGTKSTEAHLSFLPVLVWGDNVNGQTNLPPGLSNIVAVAGGYGFSLALRGDGHPVGWGNAGYSIESVPAGLSNVVGIGTAAFHSLALRADGSVFAWGDDLNGQTDVPQGLSNVVAVAARGYDSLALRDDGIVAAWGDYRSGQTSVPTGLSKLLIGNWFLGAPVYWALRG